MNRNATSSGPQPQPSASQDTAKVYDETIPVAQKESEPANPIKEPKSRLVEEIVVTAQKREENLQDVPISVQAFSGEMLDALGVGDQTDLQRITPGLNVTNQVSYVMTFLRGVGTDATIAAEPSVATYIDGIYYPFASNLAQNFGAVDRIEVLKGPQGTLYGRNASGGSINFITRAPADTRDAQLELTYGSFETVRAQGHVNLPMGDSAARIAFIASEGDGYIRNSVDDRRFAEEDYWGVRGSLRLAPTEDLRIDIMAQSIRDDGGVPAELSPHAH